MQNKKRTRVGSEAQYGPRSAGEILHDHLENSNEPLATAYRKRASKKQGWHANTMLAVDVKTLLRSDNVMRPGREYQGVLRRDVQVDEFCWDEHLTFTETVPQTAGKRNPRIFNGRYISVTRRDDGSLRPNFKNLETGAGFKVERYALGVYNELCMALEGLIEEG